MKNYSILILVTVLLGAGCVKATTVQIPPSPSTVSSGTTSVTLPSNPETISTSLSAVHYLTEYKEEKLGYSFSVPSGSYIESEQPGGGRIQNYPSNTDKKGLDAGEYYLEFYSVAGPDREIKDIKDCALDRKGKSISYGDGFSAWVGLGSEGGEAGGQRYQLCAVSKDLTINLSLTSTFVDGTRIVNNVFQSFRPTVTAKSNPQAFITP